MASYNTNIDPNEAIESALSNPYNLIDIVPTVNKIYSELGFKDQDKLTDEDRINEWQYIYKNFSSFVSKKGDEIRAESKQMNPDLLGFIEKTYSKLNHRPKERREFIFQVLRNMWLDNVHKVIKEILIQEANKKEPRDEEKVGE